MYATLADMRDRFKTDELVQLTDEAGVGTIDTTKIDAALADADSEINSYIAAVYTAPPTGVPGILTRYACDIARYNLYGDAAPEQVRTRYEDALTWLTKVSKGTVKLSIDGVEVEASPETITVEANIIADKRERMRGF